MQMERGPQGLKKTDIGLVVLLAPKQCRRALAAQVNLTLQSKCGVWVGKKNWESERR